MIHHLYYSVSSSSLLNETYSFSCSMLIVDFLMGLSITSFLFIIYYLNMKDLRLRTPIMVIPIKINNNNDNDFSSNTSIINNNDGKQFYQFQSPSPSSSINKSKSSFTI